MERINLADAKARLSEIVDRVEAGESIEIVRRGNRFEADEKYFLPGVELQNHHGGMVLVGDYLYGGHGHNNGFPVCVELATGKIAWRKNRGPGTGSAAVTYADGNLYFRYESGLVALIAATPLEDPASGKPKEPQVIQKVEVKDVTPEANPYTVLTSGNETVSPPTPTPAR